MAAWLLFFVMIILWAVYVAGVFLTQLTIGVDCIVIAVVSGMAIKKAFEIHSAYCFLIGIVIFFVFLVIAQTKIGFWLITIPFSMIFGAFCGIIALAITDDSIWMCTIFGLSTIIAILTHVYSSNAIAKECEEDRARNERVIVTAASPKLQDLMNKVNEASKQQPPRKKGIFGRYKSVRPVASAEEKKIREETLRNNPNCELPKL